MKQSEKNKLVLTNFALYHSGSDEALHDELLSSIEDYIEEDHVDGKPADDGLKMYVYIVDKEGFKDENQEKIFADNNCSDVEFIQIAIEQKNEYPLADFQKQFNNGDIYIDSDFLCIRFIEINT
jgi:hypothetical protein